MTASPPANAIATASPTSGGPASKRPVDAAAAAAGMDGPSKQLTQGLPPTPAWTPANGRRRPQAAWKTGPTPGRFPTAPTGQERNGRSGTTTTASLTR
jgi:hypothetical protein